jgi:hypothetical protein
MRDALWRRALKVYAAHAGMLLFLFTVVAAIGISTDRHAITNLISFYLHEPVTALWTGFALIYNPPLLDILPMYVVLMFATPLALTLGIRGRWGIVLAGSLLLWLLAQFGLSRALYGAVVMLTGLKVPLHETGAFEIVAWQFLWIFGLYMGSARVTALQTQGAPPRWLVVPALAVGVGCLVWRHVVGQAPFGHASDLNVLFDKWQLAPLRLLDFTALVVLALRYGPALARVARLRFLEVLGAASLPVFCAHLVVVLLALAAVGDRRGAVPMWQELLLLAGSFVVLYAVAALVNRLDGERRMEREAERAISAGAA